MASFDHSPTTTRRARRWWRALAVYAFVALAWPSLGPLPWLGAQGTARALEVAHAHGRNERASHHHPIDASSIPGSPTHPADHDCAECEVLKHLSRCMLATPTIAVVPSPVVCMVSAQPAIAMPATSTAALLPPARAPPASSF